MINIEEIKTKTEEVLKYSQHINSLDLTHLMDEWYNAKEFFIQAMNGELIYQHPCKVAFHLSEENKRLKKEEFVNNLTWDRSTYELGRYLSTRSVEEFFSNIINEEFCYNDVIIPKGMKLVKSFKFFIENEDLLFNIQQAASAIIAEDKIEGYPCISVHPLDYLSVSENDYNWRSCHALNGDYRAGNLSYMCDKSTIVCYIKGDDDNCILLRFPDTVPWNSKKWRMFMFLADEHNALFAGRQYPFILDDAMEFFRDILFNLLNYHVFNWSNWHNDQLDRYKYKDETEYMEFNKHEIYIPIGGTFISLFDLVVDAEGSKHYNDLLYSNYYTPYYCWRLRTKENIHFTIGSHVHCVCCGEKDPVGNEMVCRECGRKNGVFDNYINCDWCGVEIPEPDSFWIRGVHNTCVCPNCVAMYTQACDRCDEFWSTDEMHYIEETGTWICPDCFRSMIRTQG